jgi:hypothetical protein
MSRRIACLTSALAFLQALAVMAVSATACEGGGGGGKELTTLATKLSGESKEGEELTVLEGSKVKDQAKLSGKNASKATGKVTYKVYSDKECKTLVTSAGEVTVSGESVPASSEEELEGGKTYYWQAHYSGDTNNAESTSSCTEILNVKAKTSLATKLSGESKEGEELTVLEGAKVKDKATLSGTNSSSAGGKALYKVYSDKECKTPVTEAGEVTVSSGSVPASTEVELEGGKTYYWQVTYKGDGLHQESISSCGTEILNVKAKTSLATKLSGESKEAEHLTIQEEQAVLDTATLGGIAPSSATGTVTYSVYSDIGCTELAKEVSTATLEGGGKVPSSKAETFPLGSYYYWQAVYSGDGLHTEATSPCSSETVQISDETSISTSLTAETPEEALIEGTTIEVPEGSQVADTATLSGVAASSATGTVTFGIYSDSECTHLVLELPEGLLSGLTTPTSLSTSLPVGTYYWQVTYAGDSQNQPSTSSCGSEVTTVVSAPLTTVLSSEAATGEEVEVDESVEVTDAATLHSESPTTATGTVTYKVYSDAECTELASTAGAVTLEAGGKIPSSTPQSFSPGTYYWQVTYSGDGAHKAQESECGIEVQVVADTTSVSTSLTDGTESGEAIAVTEGTPITDTATIHGAKASLATETITYYVYSDSSCENLVADAGEELVTGAEAPPSSEESLPPGTYYWRAEYSGDSVNAPSWSTCGAEVENVYGLTVLLSGEGHTGAAIEVEEAPVLATAYLHGLNASTATGGVAYAIYSDSNCEHLITKAGETSMNEGVAPASEPKTEAPGTYYWQASYEGDGTHLSATSPCEKAEESVTKGPMPWVVSVGDSYISGEGGRWAGNTMLNSEWQQIDALGNSAYFGEPNEEPQNGEAIPLCHRSKSAEIFIGGGIRAKNFACSGGETRSASSNGVFKPGLDFVNVLQNGQIREPGTLPRGLCPLVTGCQGQAKMLEIFAQTHRVKMIVVSIGGNDFQFAPVVTACVRAYFTAALSSGCRITQKALFEEGANNLLKKRQEAIEEGITRIGLAMERDGYAKTDYTIVVQDYPSPIPKEAAEFRYDERESIGAIGPSVVGRVRAGPIRHPFGFLNSRTRMIIGACPFLNADAKWANEVALPVIDETVRKAKAGVAATNKFQLALLELENAFSPDASESKGRRLCENGLTLIGGERLFQGFPTTWLFPGPGTPPSTENYTEWFNQIRLRVYNALHIPLLANAPFTLQEDFHPNFWGQLALRNCVRKEYNNGAPLAKGVCTLEGQGLVAAPRMSVPGEALTVRDEPRMELNP